MTCHGFHLLGTWPFRLFRPGGWERGMKSHSKMKWEFHIEILEVDVFLDEVRSGFRAGRKQ